VKFGDQPLIIFAGLPLFAYLLGSIAWGVVWTRLFSSADITKEGSENIGATNVSRVAGPALGLLTLACDFFKGAVPVYLAVILAGHDQNAADILPAIVGLAAFGGHLYPVYSGLKNGGKGVATAAGCFLVLAPTACLSALVVFVALVFVSRRVSAGSLAAALALPIAAWIVTRSWEISACAAIMTVFIFIRHTDNVKRLLNGTEPAFKTGGNL
jgi:glycerol-3-phosphate acyltransferase PlsY